MSKGFLSNAYFFHLGFLDKDSVARGKQLEKLLPVLWMKAGGYGKCPTALTDDKYIYFKESKFAILLQVKYAYEFMQEFPDGLEAAYIITDYEPEYQEIANNLKVPVTYQLYRDYLDNFKINMRRG